MPHDLVEQQQAEIAFLRERIRQLEEALIPPLDFPVAWGLTGAEARVFAHLKSRPVATKQSIMMALYSDRPGAEPEIKIVDVFICKLRKKLTPFGVVIETVWGRGYGLASNMARCLA